MTVLNKRKVHLGIIIVCFLQIFFSSYIVQSSDTDDSILSINNGASPVDWNKDGSKIASGSSDGTIKIWDALTGNEILALEPEEAEEGSIYINYGYHQAIDWSPDDTKLAAGFTAGNIVHDSQSQYDT